MEPIYIETTIKADMPTVWSRYNEPQHIVHWNFASDDWHCPSAKVDFREGGTFCNTMAAKDGSFQFDFEGTYDKIEEYKTIAYSLGDSRRVNMAFSEVEGGVKIGITFDPEQMNPIEMQRGGWFAILENFRKYAES